VTSGGTVAWYLPDRLGTVRNISDSSGTLIDTIIYDSYGNVTSETNATNGDRFKFTGREYDSSTGLYYYRARYYDPAVGRFMRQDPMGFAAGDANLYRYVANGPLLHSDPTGLLELSLFARATTGRGRQAGRLYTVEVKGTVKPDLGSPLVGVKVEYVANAAPPLISNTVVVKSSQDGGFVYQDATVFPRSVWLDKKGALVPLTVRVTAYEYISIPFAAVPVSFGSSLPAMMGRVISVTKERPTSIDLGPVASATGTGPNNNELSSNYDMSSGIGSPYNPTNGGNTTDGGRVDGGGGFGIL
jgi:RHS repeat-associated protein